MSTGNEPKREAQVVGRYELKSRLGKGGMGEVWLSQHPDLHIPVAVKLCRSIAGDTNGDEQVRFVREAQATAALDHPNVVRVYEAHFEDDQHYIVMEYVDGGNAADLARNGDDRLGPDVATELTRQVAAGLQAAARKGIIHRDIKPANILVTKDGQFKVTDLGIARRQTESTEAGLTGTGHIIGTPEYMSPEQALDSREVDLRSDIYSLGATLYHLVTGRPAFTADAPLSVLMKHVQEPLPHPHAVRQDLPDNLCAVICKMMEKRPLDRYQSYEELLKDLKKIRDPDATVAALHAGPAAPASTRAPSDTTNLTPPRMRKRRRLWHVSWLLLTVVIFTLVAFALLRKRESRMPLAKKKPENAPARNLVRPDDAQSPRPANDPARPPVTPPVAADAPFPVQPPRIGPTGKVLSLDGQSLISIPSIPEISGGSEVSLTVEFLMCPLGPGTLISKIANWNDKDYAIGLSKDHVVGFLCEREGKGYLNSQGKHDPLALREWYHIALCLDGKGRDVGELFVNGTRVATGTLKEHSARTRKALEIGGTSFYRTYAPMLVDEVRVWNRPLTPDEIQASITNRPTADTPGLVGWWTFDDGTMRDASLKQNHARAMGAAKVVAWDGSSVETLTSEIEAAAKEDKSATRDKSTGGPPATAGGSISVRAVIDGTGKLKIRGNEIWYEHGSGGFPGKRMRSSPVETTVVNGADWSPVWQGKVSKRFTFTGPGLSTVRPTAVELEKTDGRGKVAVLEQPDVGNDYTLTVAIRDTAGGADDYAFRLTWGK